MVSQRMREERKMKKLNVPYRFTVDDVENEVKLDVNISPNLSKLSNGFYYIRHLNCAFILYNSNIYQGSVSEWLSDFELVDHKPLRDIEYETLKKLVKLGIANKENKELLYKEEHYRLVKNLRRNTKKVVMKKT
jgi:hypothetical protein